MQRGPRYKDAFVGTTPLPSSTVVAVADLTVLSCEWAGGSLSRLRKCAPPPPPPPSQMYVSAAFVRGMVVGLAGKTLGEVAT